MKVSHITRALPRPSCAQAAAHCFLLWILPPCDLAAHLHQLCGWKKKKKMGHCTVTKKTFTENTAIKKSLSSTGLKCPKEARICRAWVPGADRLTKQHKLRHQPTRDTFQNSIRQKEIGRIHWWRGCEACGGGEKAVFYITSINRNIWEPLVPGLKNRALQQKIQ